MRPGGTTGVPTTLPTYPWSGHERTGSQGRHHHGRLSRHRSRPRRRLPATGLGGRGHVPDDQAGRRPGDISEAATTDRIISGALGRFGRIDTLVNNAGVYISKPFTDYTSDDYATVVGVNLTGFFTLTQGAIGEMLKRGSGHIVNITTTLADYADSSTPSVLTSLTKGGLASATKSLAVEYASRGIRVNAVSPGIIQTPVHPAESYAGLGAQLPPLGHVGQVRDIVDGVMFLESSPFITGEVLHIDGGQIAGH
jgi:NAD(P)-dependent dehydrogenase (short-subunit alcohol dehydrogenase family)